MPFVDRACLTFFCLLVAVFIVILVVLGGDLAKVIRRAILNRRRQRQLARLRVWFPAVYERREWRARL